MKYWISPDHKGQSVTNKISKFHIKMGLWDLCHNNEKEVLKEGKWRHNKSYLKPWDNAEECVSCTFLLFCNMLADFFKECWQSMCTCVSTPRCELKTEDNLWDPATLFLPLGLNLGHKVWWQIPHLPWFILLAQRMLFLYSITFYIIWKIFYLSSSYHSSEFNMFSQFNRLEKRGWL